MLRTFQAMRSSCLSLALVVTVAMIAPLGAQQDVRAQLRRQQEDLTTHTR